MSFEVTNISTNVQNDFSEFEDLLHEMVSKKPFMSQQICYINWNGKKRLCTVFAHIDELLRIVEIDDKNSTDALS